MSKHHYLKILPCFFAEVIAGNKHFEIRRNNDRDFQRGDTVTLQEVSNPCGLPSGQGMLDDCPDTLAKALAARHACTSPESMAESLRIMHTAGSQRGVRSASRAPGQPPGRA